MSVQNVRAQIAIAKIDHTITSDEARAIIAAAKYNLTRDELVEIRGVVEAISSKQLHANAQATSLLTVPWTPGSDRGVGAIVGETVASPILGAVALGERLFKGTNTSLSVLDIDAGLFLMLLGATLVIALSPLTALIGVCRAAVVKARD